MLPVTKALMPKYEKICMDCVCQGADFLFKEDKNVKPSPLSFVECAAFAAQRGADYISYEKENGICRLFSSCTLDDVAFQKGQEISAETLSKG